MCRFTALSRISLKICLLATATIVASACVAFAEDASVSSLEKVPKDSITVDGRSIFVDAQVHFDSLATDPKLRRNLNPFRSLSVFSGFNNPRIELGLTPSIGIGKGPLAGRSWRQWTCQSDVAQMLSLQAIADTWEVRVLKQMGWDVSLSGRISLAVLHLGDMDVEQIPDSVIGFISADREEAWSAVVYERYSNGIETDTVPMFTHRQSAFQLSLALGLCFEHRNGWEVQLHAGLVVNSRDVHRVQMVDPELDGDPWGIYSQEARTILPAANARLGHVLWHAGNWKWTAWSQCSFQPKSIQNAWFGLGLTASHLR